MTNVLKRKLPHKFQKGSALETGPSLFLFEGAENRSGKIENDYTISPYLHSL